jgi:hypothetical protein
MPLRGTGFVAPETALMRVGLHSIVAGPQSLPLTRRSTDQPHHFMLPTVWMEYTLMAHRG